MNKQKHLNLVHVTLDMSTQKQKTVNSEAEKESMVEPEYPRKFCICTRFDK